MKERMLHISKRTLALGLCVLILVTCVFALMIPASAATEVSVLNGTGSRGAVEVTG